MQCLEGIRQVGYRFIPWLSAEIAFDYSPLFLSSNDLPHGTSFVLMTSAGVLAYPLGKNYRIEPVIGIHFGYFYKHDKMSIEAHATSGHGFIVDYTIGFHVELTPVLSLGIGISIFDSYLNEYTTMHFIYFCPFLTASVLL